MYSYKLLFYILIPNLLIPHKLTSNIFTNVYHQCSWLITSYQLYRKTKQLVELNQKHLTENTPYQIPNINFTHHCFSLVTQKTIFDEQLYHLRRSWKTWSHHLPREWALEYSILLFSLYKKMFESECKKNKNLNPKATFKQYDLNTFLIHINLIYTNIQELPLESILGAIDLISDAIPTFFNKYGSPSEEEHLHLWIKKHWFVILATITPLILRILILFKTNRYYLPPTISFGTSSLNEIIIKNNK